MECQKKKRDGRLCGAPALSGKKCCALHSEPGRAASLGSRGGRRRAVYFPEGLKDYAAPTSAADLRDLLAQSIVEIRMGKLDPKLANSISSLGAASVPSHRPGQWMFSSSVGTPIDLGNLVNRVIRPTLAKAGLTWRGYHVFRRGLATTLYSLNVPELIVQRILRRKPGSPATRTHYIQTPTPDVLDAMDKSSRCLDQLRFSNGRLFSSRTQRCR